MFRHILHYMRPESLRAQQDFKALFNPVNPTHSGICSDS